jgi:diaminohydroxyphosphoribosylaminopyrimidine deaminase / 5-amino-6-(5-phosphoribosylamino)uracil reductase
VVTDEVADDVKWMRRALHHARRGLGRTTPNPVVGACVVSSDGVVVADGSHERAGEPHAEVHALAHAGARARGATLYCTLEPCAHTGRTGPCTERIIAAGIRRVVCAMEDPNPLVSGRGFAILREHGIDVSVGLERDAAARLNLPFITSVREDRPFLILKAATSIDGYIAAAPGQRTAITSGPALRHAQYVRAQVDAIAIGSETALIDDPLLTAREVYRERPLARVIFDRRLRTSPEARMFSTLNEGPLIVVGAPDAHGYAKADELRSRGADVIAMSGTYDLGQALRELSARGIQSLLLEGGAALHNAAWDAGVVDRVQLYVAPGALGPGGVPFLEGRSFSTTELNDLQVTPLGPDVLFDGYVHRPH